MNPLFFESSAALHQWLQEHHQDIAELWVGIYKKQSGRASVTWDEVKLEILCFGWAEGKIQPLDADSYAVRINPRKPKSKWSLSNVQKFQELLDLNLVTPMGIQAFETRDLAYEEQQRQDKQITSLTPAFESRLQANSVAWNYWEQAAPSYRKAAIRWVMRAKQVATRERRMDTLITSCEEGQKIPPMRKK
ncbi:MAG: YdeI/OmpD-associated family protein [Bacteroidota bacterium]